MKKVNGNNLTKGEYYLGLDIGTESVGWAVTDISEDYNILKFKGNLMQGVRLFDKADDSKERRAKRTSRRRLNRTKQRLLCLEELFYEEITKIDPYFFVRLSNSFLMPEDKEENIKNAKYTLFNDDDLNDVSYMKRYPSIYHLRNDLVKSKDKHDIRLVYLAIHHILKKRGHFLFDGTADSDITVKKSLDELKLFIEENYNVSISIAEKTDSILSDNELNITNKKRKLNECISIDSISEDSDSEIDAKYVAEILSGSNTDLSKLFKNEDYKGVKVRLSDDLDEKFDELSLALGDDIELITALKAVFDSARLTSILGNNTYICEAKVKLFKKNKNDLQKLKYFVKENCGEKYKHIFCEKNEKLNNYAAYSRKKVKYTCTQEDFCAFLKKELNYMKDLPDYSEMWNEINENRFLTRLSSKDNGLIPNQLHRKELKKILENASAYLPFLNDSDEYGTVTDKILSIFDFKIPYYVGPLNSASDKSWSVRKIQNEKIYPWNFRKVIDFDASAAEFMKKLIGRCEYTGDPVLPKDSLLYSEFSLLNELNPLKVNGTAIDIKTKQMLVDDLFINSKKNVSKKSIHDYLVSKGIIKSTDVVSGIDDMVKTKLKSYQDFERILNKYNDSTMVEEIIQGILVYGDDKKLLRNWLNKNYPLLSGDDINYICRLKYKDWGRFSKAFLTSIYAPDENGEAFNIIEMLRNTNLNLNQILSSEYSYISYVDEYKKEHYAFDDSIKSRLDDMYISPSTRRAVLQAVRITDEIVDIMKSAPKKIFIEVAREHDPDRGRTETRKNTLLNLYKECGEDSGELYEKLVAMDDSRLRDNTVYLYFMQLGKCMYSGEQIDLDHLTDQSYYDIDHIYPRSKILDDSLDNKVLVKSKLNRDKTNKYPIAEEIRTRMTPFWTVLKNKNIISEKKYARLVRSTELTSKELSEFVNRQLVETQQSTKAVATLFKEIFEQAGTKIVYSKAGNVSRFRNQYDLVKCRDVNDLHHAKDAYLNIVVGNVYDTKFTEKFFLNIRNEEYSLNRVFDYNVPGAWVADVKNSGTHSSISSVKKNYGKNSVRYTRMPKEVKGEISDGNILPAGKGQLSIKRGMDMLKYGGYNKVSGSYFILVEHTFKGKRVRTFEPVYIYAKPDFQKDPLKYCTDILKLDDPVIIEKKIFMDSLIEYNGIRYHITGRSGDAIVGKHAYQLVLNENMVKYAKEVIDYVSKCNDLKRDIDPRLFKTGKRNIEINAENNITFYECLSDKLNSNVYNETLKNIRATVDEGSDKFKLLSVEEQCRVLVEILKSLKCDRQLSDLKLIGGSGQSGVLKFNKNITNCKGAFIIDQSVTGLFEYKRDLLRKI